MLNLLFTGVWGQVVAKLQTLGMENIRMVETGGTTVVAFEDNVYRGTYRGIGKAIIAALEGVQAGGLEMVVLDNSIPQLSIIISEEVVRDYKDGKAGLQEVYTHMQVSSATDAVLLKLKDTPVSNSSTWKTDIVVYPEIHLENSRLDKLYLYEVSVAPAIELSPWKGGEFTAQVILPIVTNMVGQYKQIRPGVIALAQEFRLKGNLLGRIAAGNFTNNRMGAQAELTYRLNNGRWELGAVAGSTVFSGIVEGEGWYITTKPRVNAAAKIMWYEPHSNLQVDLQAGRFVYGDYGVRGDCTRHFGEYAIGVYGTWTSGTTNAGFHFTIPLPGKKWARSRNVRVRPAEYFAAEYGIRSSGRWVNDNLGYTYETRPDANRSERFYQPDYVRYFLIKELNK